MTISGPEVDLATQQGWFTDFDKTVGERVNLDVKIVAGSLNVVTTIPSASSACSVGGSSNLYAFDVCKSVGDTATGGQVGKTISANSALVGFVIISLPNGTLVLRGKDAAGRDPGAPLPPQAGGRSRRSGWRRIQN